jgi:hypothetical protein
MEEQIQENGPSREELAELKWSRALRQLTDHKKRLQTLKK